MKKTAIVTDSTAYLTPDLINRFGIEIVPLSVTIGAETYPETELPNETLFNRLKEISGFSTTSQPSVGSFIETYKKLLDQGFTDIISIHLSQTISGTFRSAQMARDMLKNENIHIFDSESAALGLGLLVWAASEWTEQDWSIEKIIDNLTHLKSQTKLYFIVDSLENLHRGGRIGGASALFGTLLQIKPILYINNEGKIDVFDKVRSKARAWQRVVTELENALMTGQRYRICVQHVQCTDQAEKIYSELQRKFPGHDIRIFEAGAVIATHVGAGAFGISYQPWPRE